MARLALIAALVAALHPAAAAQLADVLAGYGLTESYNFTFPDKTLKASDADNWILDKWSVNSHGIVFGNEDITFVDDPAGSFPTKREAAPAASTSVASTKDSGSSSSSSSGNSPVLRIEYPKGSYSAGTGGTQFYAQPLNASSDSRNIFPNTTSNGQFERMLLTYDIFFQNGYDFNKGGKLPGLRGGPDPMGCSGGHKTDGMECFSTRLMWREGALGEVYAYIPTEQKDFCKSPEITCNSDFGTSLSRGSFSFQTGRWQTIWLYVALNRDDLANGVMSLWYNGVRAFELSNLEIRADASIESIGGLYFSTFFGGYDQSWASPADQYSYFRNIQLHGGLGAANGTGNSLSGAVAARPSGIILGVAACVAVALAGIVF